MNYTKDKTTYFAKPKDDPKDRIELEVGDSKEADFIPQVKIMRWDNEVNLSYRLKDSEIGTEKVTDKDGKIVWSKGNLEAHFYDLSLTEHPEGAFEFDITLKEKPATNKVEFSLNDKGVEYFYQPALTQQEIDEGAVRPENVIGSYAVYYKDCPANYVDGKLYRTGKFCHIYRPQIIDANGNKVWGELAIDEQAGILTVTIPQEFLDSALYPILVDPTFGYTTQGASSQYSNPDLFDGSVFTSPAGANGTVSSLSFYSASEGTGNSKGIIILHSNLSLLSNGVGSIVDLPLDTPALLTSTFSTPPTITENTEYILGVVCNSADAFFKYDTGTANQGHTEANNYTTPTGLTSPTHSTRQYSIYATYTEPAFLGFNIALV